MGRRQWIVVGAIAAVAVAGIGWSAWPRHARAVESTPYTGHFGLTTLDRSTGRVSASATLTNTLSRTAKFEIHLACNPGKRSVMDAELHSPLVTLGPGSSFSWKGRSQPLRTRASPDHPSHLLARSDLARLAAYEGCAYWVATPGVPQ